MTIDLDRLDAIYQSTSPGPWTQMSGEDDIRSIMSRSDRIDGVPDMAADYVWKDDADWIVALHEAWPELRDELKRLREENVVDEEKVKILIRAAHAWAYERAASICEQLANRYDKPLNVAASNAAHAQLECADAIRWLKEAK